MTDPNDMEDPQAGEVLPPMLYEVWWAMAMRVKPRGQTQNSACDKMIKQGMELAYQQLKPLMQAALPYFEAGVCDTRTGQADAGKLAELERYKGIVNYAG